MVHVWSIAFVSVNVTECVSSTAAPAGELPAVKAIAPLAAGNSTAAATVARVARVLRVRVAAILDAPFAADQGRSVFAYSSADKRRLSESARRLFVVIRDVCWSCT